MIVANGQWSVASGEWLIASGEKEESPKGRELVADERVATQLDIKRLKLIDELSRVILELKKEFPELAQNLAKARDNISINFKNIPVKNLMEVLNTIQQNLSKPELNSSKPEFTENVKISVNNAIKILSPSTEIPPENKLILALSQNDFKSANIAIKNIIEPQAARPPQILAQQSFQIILNALQELKYLGTPRELQSAPLKELENIILQKTGIEVDKNFVQKIQATVGELSERPVFTANNEPAFSLYKIAAKNETKFILQTWPASMQIPVEERAFWLKTELPFTPQTLSVRDTILSFGKLPESPEPVRLFANFLHEASLRTEGSTPITKEQANLLWRIAQIPPQAPPPPYGRDLSRPSQIPIPIPSSPPQIAAQIPPQIPAQATPQIPAQAPSPLPPSPLPPSLPLSPYGRDLSRPSQILPQIPQQFSAQITHTLLKYQPLGNLEGDLFKNLPEPIKKELLRELPTGKTWQPEILQKAIEYVSRGNEEIRLILQNLKEQIQWTRIDQDTRPASDRENIFYFMHEGELQKGRLKVKDERKDGGKKQQGSSISFSIETKTKNLGNVHADLTLSRSILNIRLQDSIGTAGEAVEKEREMLARELADIGISLGELIYGKTPKTQKISIKTEIKSSGGLDVRA
ncbi:MAG: hypothetical protein LBC85_07300 [Fibromonadaceae bacterium]|jgi:hypothetical protein|nr:hypothetical protein [Fibromonadaceae bacterium]